MTLPRSGDFAANRLERRFVLAPHSAFYSPDAGNDIRRKSAETMAAALLSNAEQNVIGPDSY